MQSVIPAEFDPVVVETIQQRLDSVERDEEVSLIAAVESGSRAWGFPSPDSDYDCRFIYRRRPQRYLSLWQERDVIETPLDDVYEVNGWDIAKALRLLVKGNAVAIEWLTSPVTYRCDGAARTMLAEFARDHADPLGVRRHYFHLATGQFQRHLITSEHWRVKSMFYAVRPAAALRWLRQHPSEVLLPMSLWDLLEQGDADTTLIAVVREFAELKASCPEHHEVAPDNRIKAFVQKELTAAADTGLAAVGTDSASRADAADHLFRQILALPWPNSEE